MRRAVNTVPNYLHFCLASRAESELCTSLFYTSQLKKWDLDSCRRIQFKTWVRESLCLALLLLFLHARLSICAAGYALT